MRPSNLMFISFVLVFSVASHARKINLDDVTNGALIKLDAVQRTLSNSFLVEKHNDAIKKEWVIKVFSLKDESKLPVQELSSSLVLASFQKLAGMEHVSFDAIKDFQLSPDLSRLLFYVANDLFVFSRENGETERITSSEVAKEEFQLSPNGQSIAYLEEFNLWVVDIKTRQTRQLTFDGNENLLHGKLDWVYQEEIFGRGDFRGFWWSPDSESIAFLRINEAPVKKFPLIDDTEIYGNLRLMSYPKAGTENPMVDIGVVKARGGEIVWADLSPYQGRTPLIVGVSFNKDSSQLLYQVQNRTQSRLDLRAHDMSNGQSVTLWSEESSTWINRLQDTFSFTDEGFYFLSERSGYSQIYFYGYREQTAQQITHNDFEVKKILNATGNYLYFVANEESLREDQLFSLNKSSGEVVRLLRAGEHHEVTISENGFFMIATSQSHISPPEKKLFALTGATATSIRNLHRADVSELEKLDLQRKEYLTITNRRGQKMQALIFSPTDFDAKKTYPLMAYVYCGPKSPSVTNRFNVSFEMWHHYLAQEGFLVVMMDCHSANSIGHAGESIVHKKLGVAELEDLEDAVNDLKKRSAIDAQRIGLWGWSYGGFMTSFAMTRTEHFKIGIAVAPVTDWRLYDTIYTERYMCTPQENDEGFRCSSVLERAENLSGELLLVHGTMDDNVHQQNSLKFAYKVQQKGKTNLHQLLYLQNNHSLSGVRKQLFSTMERFIKKNL